LGLPSVSAELKGSHFGRFRMSQIFDECLRGAGMRWPRSQIKQSGVTNFYPATAD
jgi:hypothetical protein